jgi:hypothetical protein
MIDKDEYEQWRDNPITRWFLEGVTQAAEEQREQFLSCFFYGDAHDKYKMGLVRGAFIGIYSVVELTHDKLVELHESGEIGLDLSGVWITPGSGERQ